MAFGRGGKLCTSQDGLVRSAKVRTKSAAYLRPISQFPRWCCLSLIVIESHSGFNSGGSVIHGVNFLMVRNISFLLSGCFDVSCSSRSSMAQLLNSLSQDAANRRDVNVIIYLFWARAKTILITVIQRRCFL